MATHVPQSGPVRARITRQDMSFRSGCLAKLPPCDLDELLAQATELVGGNVQSRGTTVSHQDSACINVGSMQLLCTTDIGPLVGIDLWIAGRIAAFHAMSDIYASGGIPRWALVTFIVDPGKPDIDMAIVLAGILEACKEDGAEVVGGHTSIGAEAMAGLTVLGLPRSSVILGKKGALPGDVLLLSKPLGTGLVVRAFKLGLVDESALNVAVSTMTSSNASASAQAVDVGAHACTDVTGFGLLGHLAEMLSGGLGASLELRGIPLLDIVHTLPEDLGRSFFAEGNLKYVKGSHTIDGLPDLKRLAPLIDPQTNGGLLVAVSPDAAKALCAKGFYPIGSVTNSDRIELRG